MGHRTVVVLNRHMRTPDGQPYSMTYENASMSNDEFMLRIEHDAPPDDSGRVLRACTCIPLASVIQCCEYPLDPAPMRPEHVRPARDRH